MPDVPILKTWHEPLPDYIQSIVARERPFKDGELREEGSVVSVSHTGFDVLLTTGSVRKHSDWTGFFLLWVLRDDHGSWVHVFGVRSQKQQPAGTLVLFKGQHDHAQYRPRARKGQLGTWMAASQEFDTEPDEAARAAFVENVKRHYQGLRK